MKHGVLLALVAASAMAQDCPPGMLLVPGGPFVMGDLEGFPDERPLLQLTVKSFCLDATEVTVAAYAACAHEGSCSPAHVHPEWSTLKSQEMKQWSELCNTERPDRLTHPVNCIVADEGARYCAAHGFRLPTEAEWEYAARGGNEERQFPWGAAAPTAQLANLCGAECEAAISGIRGAWAPLYPDSDGYVATAPVGSFPAGDGRWGHHDLTGNVCEWVSGNYCPYDHPDCGVTAPMCRGNHFLANKVKKARPGRRNSDGPEHRGPDVGFRCAADVGNSRPPTAPARPTIGLDLPSFPRVALAAGLALLAGLAMAWLRGAAALVLGTLVFVEQLDPEMAISTSFVVMTAAAAAALARPSMQGRVAVRAAAPLAFAAFTTAFAAAASGGFLAPRLQLAALSVAMVALAVQLARPLSLSVLVTSRAGPLIPGAIAGFLGFAPGPLFEALVRSRGPLLEGEAEATSLLLLLAAALGGALGAGLHAHPDPGLVLVMSGFAVAGALLKSLAPSRAMSRPATGLMAFAVFALGTIIFAREILPAEWLPWL